MDERQEIPLEAQELFSAAVDGQLQDEQFAALEKLLVDDAAMLTPYFISFQLDSDVSNLFQGERAIEGTLKHIESLNRARLREDSSDTATQPVTAKQRGWFGRVLKHEFAMGVTVAAVIFAVVLVVLDWTKLPERVAKEGAPSVEKQSEHVAILNGERGVTWVEGKRKKAHDPRLWPGERLVIEEGLIELKYMTGARVVIEGPAEFVVGGTEAAGTKALATEPAERLARGEGEGGSKNRNGKAESGGSNTNSGFLKHGKLVARCNTAKSKGFTIHTPLGRVEDLGTEFGVDVEQDGRMQVAVLTGKVELISGDGEESEQRVRLAKGEGAFVEAAGSAITRLDKADVRFVAAMRSRLKAIRVEPLADASIIGFEAESGTLGSEFDPALTDAGALGGSYITTKTDNNSNTTHPISDPFTVSYSLNVAAGTYDVYVRARINGNANNDSFYYANAFGDADPTDEDDWQMINGANSFGVPYDSFGWSNALTTTVTSAGGIVTWEIGAREIGFDMDAFALVIAGQSVTHTALDHAVRFVAPETSTAARGEETQRNKTEADKLNNAEQKAALAD